MAAMCRWAVKLAPDLEDEAIDDIAKVLLAKESTAIATNTTLSRLWRATYSRKPPRMAACPVRR